MLDDDEQPIRHPAPSQKSSTSMTNASAMNSSAALAQQEREFKKAVQPSSPISALLGAARQPLITGPGAMNGREREQPLIRKLQAVAKEGRSGRSGLGDSQISSLASSVLGGTTRRAHGIADLHNIEEESEPETKEERFVRRKELEAQKARIVAQMTEEPQSNVNALRQAAEMDEMENIPPPTSSLKGKLKESGMPKDLKTSISSGSKLKAMDGTTETLVKAFDTKQRGKLFRDPRMPIPFSFRRIANNISLKASISIFLMPGYLLSLGSTTVTDMAWVTDLPMVLSVFTSTTARLFFFLLTKSKPHLHFTRT